MEFLTTAEAALTTKHHPETVTRALRLGELHGTQRKKGGSWRIERKCLNAWVIGEPCPHASELVAAA